MRSKEKGGESAGRARNGECGRERTWVTSITRVDVADVLFIEVILLDMQISRSFELYTGYLIFIPF